MHLSSLGWCPLDRLGPTMMSLIFIKGGEGCLENKGSGYRFFLISSESDELFQPFFKTVLLTWRHV